MCRKPGEILSCQGKNELIHLITKKGQVYMKNSYILSGNKLYKIIYSDNEYIKVIPVTKKMTKSLAKKTYYKSQLEAVGYTIGGDLP